MIGWGGPSDSETGLPGSGRRPAGAAVHGEALAILAWRHEFIQAVIKEPGVVVPFRAAAEDSIGCARHNALCASPVGAIAISSAEEVDVPCRTMMVDPTVPSALRPWPMTICARPMAAARPCGCLQNVLGF